MKRGAEMLNKLKHWFLALSKRERVMVGTAVILAPAYLLATLVVMPMLDEYRMLDKRLETQRRNNTELAEQISELATALQHSPSCRQRREIERLEQQLATLHAEVGEHLDALVTPEQMPAILRRLLQHQPGLTLRTIRNAAPQVIRPREKTTSNEATASDTEEDQIESEANHLYRQPLVMELEGTYLDALAYVKKIHTWPEHMFIDSVAISTEEYPRHKITLKLSGISTAASLLRGSSAAGGGL